LNQKHPGGKKVQGQSEAAVKIAICGYKIWYEIEAKKFS